MMPCKAEHIQGGVIILMVLLGIGISMVLHKLTIIQKFLERRALDRRAKVQP